MNKKLYILLSLIFLLGLHPLVAQTKKKSKKKSKGETSTTSYGARIKNEPAGPKEYLHIYRSSTKGILLGNKCMEDYTEKMGFRYVMMPAGQEGSLSPVQMRLNNFAVKFVLLLKNGPFWHHRLQKKVQYCREKSGDFIG